MPDAASTRQEVIRLEIEKSLLERDAEGSGFTNVSIDNLARRFEVSEAEILRDLAQMVSAGALRVGNAEVEAA